MSAATVTPRKRLARSVRRIGTAALLLAVTPSLHGDLVARFETDKGSVDVVLEHETAPQAVANFMTLAQGTRSRVDPLTGAVTDRPLYIGETFFRTANSSSFKFAQTGSGSGDNSGNTGFTFRDEFVDSIRHLGYTLSSANAGPNTNSGQIFFTGGVAIPSFDDVHTIIGRVVDEASRGVVDAIIDAGNDGSRILDLTFQRTGPEAEAFDELAQGLPTVSVPPGSLRPTPGESTRYELETPGAPGDLLRASASENLTDWNELSEVFVGVDATGVASFDLDQGSFSRRFYHLALASHPNATAPSDYGERTLVLDYGGGAIHTYDFDEDGGGGTLAIQTVPGEPLTSSFTVIEVLLDAYSSIIVVDTGLSLTNGAPFDPVLRLGWETVEPTQISGRHRTTLPGSVFGTGPAVVER